MLRDESGITLVTVMLVMVIMTVIGIAALTVTGMENRMAGFQRTGEAATTAAESCVGAGVNIIQQTIQVGALPDAAKATNGGPVSNVNFLEGEIMGQSDNNPDLPTSLGTANTAQTVGPYTVFGDIDRLYARPRAGGALQFAGGYEGIGGGTAGGGVDIMYRIDCRSTTSASSTASRVVAIYACTATGESCQRKI